MASISVFSHACLDSKLAAAVASRRATNIATHPPNLATHPPNLTTHPPNLTTHPPNLATQPPT